MKYIKRVYATVIIMIRVLVATTAFVCMEVLTGHIDKGLTSWRPDTWDW